MNRKREDGHGRGQRAVPNDATRLLEIYACYAERTAIAFEYGPPASDAAGKYCF